MPSPQTAVQIASVDFDFGFDYGCHSVKEEEEEGQEEEKRNDGMEWNVSGLSVPVDLSPEQQPSTGPSQATQSQEIGNADQ
jgi:hypothetical protein